MIIKLTSILFHISSVPEHQATKKLRYRRRHLDRDPTFRQTLRHHDFDVVKEMATDDFVFLKGHEMNRDFQMRNHNMLQAKIRRPSERCRQVPNSQKLCEIRVFDCKLTQNSSI